MNPKEKTTFFLGRVHLACMVKQKGQASSLFYRKIKRAVFSVDRTLYNVDQESDYTF